MSTTYTWATGSRADHPDAQALLDNGDQVLIPAPDYPSWTASTSLAGGTPVHYLCDETGLAARYRRPGVEDHRAHRALVVINPNNPTGAVYGREILSQMADEARKHQLRCSPTRSTTRSSTTTPKHINMALGRT
jgi:alanine-synthesizing transaminase